MVEEIKEDIAFEKLADLDDMAEKIKDDQYSACVYNALKLHSKLKFDNFDFFVTRGEPEAHVVLWMLRDDQTAMGMHCGRHELDLLKRLLRATNLIDFKRSLCFFHLDDDLLQVVQDVAKELGGKELQVGPSQAFVYCPEKKALTCPAGYNVYRLNAASVKKMYGQWRYKDYSLSLESFLTIAESQPTAGAYTSVTSPAERVVSVDEIKKAPLEDLDPVSFVTLTHYGLLGLYRTDEEICTEYSSAVLGSCAQLMLKNGYVPIVSVEGQDPKAAEAFGKLENWEMVYHLTWAWQ